MEGEKGNFSVGTPDKHFLSQVKKAASAVMSHVHKEMNVLVGNGFIGIYNTKHF